MDYSKEFKKYATKHHGVSSTYYDKIVSSMTPYIIEERQLNVAQMDVFSRLMMDRIMFLGTAINDSVANVIQAQLLFPTEYGFIQRYSNVYKLTRWWSLCRPWEYMIPCNILNLM